MIKITQFSHITKIYDEWLEKRQQLPLEIEEINAQKYSDEYWRDFENYCRDNYGFDNFKKNDDTVFSNYLQVDIVDEQKFLAMLLKL